MTAKRRVILLLLTWAIAVGACRKQTSQSQNANSNAPAQQQQQPQGAPTGDGIASAGEKFYFRGVIGANNKIDMVLVRDGEQLTGSYSYPKVGKSIDLKGTVDKAGNLELKESDENGRATGVFKGKWKPAGEIPESGLGSIEGKWSKPDGSKQTNFSLSQQPIELAAAVHIVTKLIKETNKQGRYTIDVEYPQIEGDARFDKFNQEARAMITRDVAEWKKAETFSAADSGLELPPETQNSDLWIEYDFRLATDELISVQFTEGAYSRGAAHPNSYTIVLNYDVKNGRKLSLADLFNPKSNHLNVISQYCIKDLKQQSKKQKDSMLEDETIQSGAAARADNYKAWTITRRGLWITFDPYQVAAYAAGPQHVLVPYSALKEIIKSDGPIAALAK